MEARRVLSLCVAVLALLAWLGYKTAVARPMRADSAPAAPRRTEAGARRAPAFLLPAGARGGGHGQDRAPGAEPALGAWAVEDALEGLREPDLDDEVPVLRVRQAPSAGGG